MHGPTHQERLSSVVFLALFFFSPFFGWPSNLVDAWQEQWFAIPVYHPLKKKNWSFKIYRIAALLVGDAFSGVSVTMTNWIFFVLVFCFVIFNLGCQGRLSVLFSPNKDGNISQVNSHHFYGPLLWTDMVFHLCFYEEWSLELSP